MKSACRSGLSPALLACQSRNRRSSEAGCGNLGAPPKPPYSPSKLAAMSPTRGVDRAASVNASSAPTGGGAISFSTRTSELPWAREFIQVIAVVFQHPQQHLREGRHAIARLARK